jgi:sulfite exporter TauE/SafE
MEIWTAFLIGLGGSFHCVGMCGPLALGLPGGRGGRLSLVGGRLLYNAGRVVTYALLGGIFGLVGGMVQLAGLQQGLSVALGAAIILTGLALLLGRRVALSGAFLARGIAALKEALSRLFRSRNRASLLFIGLLNGLLPCGFVYLGLAGSLTMGSAAGGVAYMALFGLGTVPSMLVVSLGRQLVRAGARQWTRRLLPVGMLVLGMLFVLRGLGLGIPYVSPMLEGGMAGHHGMH